MNKGPAGSGMVSVSTTAWAASVACHVFAGLFMIAEGGGRPADLGIFALLVAIDLALGAWALEAGIITLYDDAGRRVPLRNLLRRRAPRPAAGAALALPTAGAGPLRPRTGEQLFPAGFVPEPHAWAVCLFYVLVFSAPACLDGRGWARSWFKDHFTFVLWSVLFAYLFGCAALVLAWDAARRSGSGRG